MAILVLDDEEERRELLQEFFSSRQIGTILASNASEAMTALRDPNSKIDRVVSDWFLGKRHYDGRELYSDEVVELAITYRLPVLLATSANKTKGALAEFLKKMGDDPLFEVVEKNDVLKHLKESDSSANIERRG